MDLNPIIFWNYYDVDERKHVWLTTTTLNKKIYFCREPECNEVAYLGLDHLCIECYNRSAYPQEHVCGGEMDYERGYKICDDRDDPLCPQHIPADLEDCETCGCTAEFRDGERICWCDSCQTTGCQYQHHCSGEREYRPEERLCDKRDDPRCPQHLSSSKTAAAVEPVRAPADLPRRNSIVTPRVCADCSRVPEDGRFHCYRGNEPLCADCEEAAYGPPSPDYWRERTGRCCQCDHFFDLICSSDRKDLCYKCK